MGQMLAIHAKNLETHELLFTGVSVESITYVAVAEIVNSLLKSGFPVFTVTTEKGDTVVQVKPNGDGWYNLDIVAF